MEFAARLMAYEPAGPAIGEMPWPLKWDASFPHNDAGALTLQYSASEVRGSLADGAMADGLEVAVEVMPHGGGPADWIEPDGARFLMVNRSSQAQDEAQVRALTLPSYGWLLRKARNLATADLLPPTHSQAGKRAFLSATSGTIVGTLLAENATRGGIPLLAGFTSATDSDGAAWANILTVYYDLGLPLADVLENLAQQGMCDWTTAERVLQVWNPDTTRSRELADSVRLVLGTDVAEAPSSESLEELVSTVLFRGEDGLLLERTAAGAPEPWGAWEGYVEQGGVSDLATATILSDAELATKGRTRQQYTRDLVLRDDTEDGVVWPLVDYRSGDWITAPTDSPIGERVRVQQITVGFDGGEFTGNVVLNDRVLDAELRRAKRMAGIVGGSSAGGGSNTRPAPEGPDRRQPAAPLGLVVDSDAYVNGTTGGIEAILSMVWDEVTTDTSGELLEVASYDVAVRDNVIGAPWNVVGSSDDTEATYAPVVPGSALQVKVRARGRYSTTPGAWSDPVTLTVATDITPPPVPTGITVDGAMTVVSVTWDGTPAMPADFARIEVAIGDTTEPTALAGTLIRAGTLQVDQALTPIGAPKYVRARAVDSSDNASDWTVALPVTATSVVADEIDAAINDAIDQALTGPVDGARLEPWTVLPNRVLIGPGDNLHGDPAMEALDAWEQPTWILDGEGKDGARALVIPASGDQTGAYFGAVAPATYAVQVNAGDQVQVYAWVFSPVALAANVARVWVRTVNMSTGATALNTAVSSPAIPANTWTRIADTMTVPSGSGDNLGVLFGLYKTGTTTDIVKMCLPDVRTRATGELMVDGAVTTRTLAADAVKAGNIDVGALDGKLITGATIRTAAGADRVELSGTSLRSISGGVTALELTPERLRVYDGGQIGGVHPGTDFGTFMGPIYTDGGDLQGFGLLIEDYDGADIVNIRSGASTAGVGTNLYLRNPSGTSTLRSDDGAVIVSANGSNESLFLSANGSGGVVQVRSDNGGIQFVTAGLVKGQFNDLGRFYLHDLGTASTGANLIHDSEGRVRDQSSSIRFKQDIEDHVVDTSAVLSLRIRSWRDKSEVVEHPDTTNRYVGLIAEEVDDLGLHEFVIYEADGGSKALSYERMFLGLLPVVQDLVTRVDALDGGPPAAMRAMAVSAATASGQVRSIPYPSTIDLTPTEPPDPSAPKETTSDD